MATIPAVLVLAATPFIFMAGCFGGMFCMNLSGGMFANNNNGCYDNTQGYSGQPAFLPTARVGHCHGGNACGRRIF